MHRPGHCLVAEQFDQPADFPPAAEMDEIAEVPASVGANGGLRPGMFAETLDELRRLGEGGGRECDGLKQSFPRDWIYAALAKRGFETAQGDA